MRKIALEEETEILAAEHAERDILVSVTK
jgi:hypothetical protein